MSQQKTIKEVATDKLWRRGVLSFKLHSGQMALYDLFYNSKIRVQTWLISRRFGKSHTLCVLALEQCIKVPNSVVKFLSPTMKQVNTNVRPLFKKILEDCPLDVCPQFAQKDYIYYFPNGSEIQLAGSDAGNADRLRGGDCLEKGTLIMTPSGPKEIENIQIGDVIYGYNKDGSISETKVVNTYNNGKKQVRNIYREGKKIAAATDNHTFLTIHNSSFSRNKLHNKKERKLQDITLDTRFIRHHIDIPCGTIKEKDAYLIGAFIGDGCCSTGVGYQLHFSEQENTDEPITKFIGNHLEVRYEKSGVNRFSFKNNKAFGKHGTPISFNYYKEWIKGQTYLTKNFDYSVVDTWDRESCLKLLAGLIDTDGNVYSGKENLELSYTSCNLNLINNIDKLIFKLYQINGNHKTRLKYENGNPQYTITIKNNFYSRKILKELTPYLILNRKQYKSEYDGYSTQTSDFCQYLKIGSEYHEAETYDLEVSNDSHLYLLASGVVTHNSHIAFIDEAGSCTNLEDTVKSILLPTTLMTNGKIILSGTPPKEPDHEFLDFVEDADAKGSLIKKTIYDNPLLTSAQRQELFDELGGETSEAARRELFCEIIKDSKTTVIPEFTKELEEEIVRDWKRPPHYDMYEGLDLGFKDLTVNILGYYDFRNNKIVIEDEVVVDFKEKNTTIETLVTRIKEKEQKNFFNYLTNEQKLPSKRVSDLDYIAINEIKKASKYEMIFEPVKKDSLDAMINFLREKLKKKEIVINPRCTTLLRHLRNAKWKKTDKSMMARSPDDSHYDALMALAYLIRGIDYRKNPFPAYYGNEQKDLFGNYIYGKETKKTDEDRMNVYRTILGMKKKGASK